MAARDELRYSVEIPLIEEQLAQTEQQYLSLGTIGEFKQRLNTLLEASLDRGDATRVDHILECLGQVEALELQLMQDAQSGLLSLETATAGAASSSPSGAARAAAMAAGAEGSEEESLDDSGDEGISRRGGPAARRGAGLIRGITIDPESIQDLPFLVPTPGRLSPGLPEEPEAPPVVLETGPLTCPICFDDWEESDARAYRRCGHRYCRECLDGHLRTLINEGKVSNEDLQCPNPACQVFPSSDEIKTLVAEETYEKYLQFLVLNELKRDDTVRWCINKACAQPIMWDPSVPKIECPACHTLFCYNCKAAWHEGKACEFVQTKEDEQFIRYIKAQGSATKPCPRCHTAISKNSGCNHMTCANCRHQWCWLCLEDYGSGHYSEGPCAGMQFTQADSLWGARAKDIGKKAAIGAGCVVAAPLVIAGGAVVLVGGLVALPFYAASKLFRR